MRGGNQGGGGTRAGAEEADRHVAGLSVRANRVDRFDDAAGQQGDVEDIAAVLGLVLLIPLLILGGLIWAGAAIVT